jgi:hypothetical protein
MKDIYILQHSYDLDGCEETKLIGAYSSEEAATEAINRLKSRSGFCDYPDDFHIDCYRIDQDNWEEGFNTIVTVYMPLSDEGVNVWRPVQAIKRIDGSFEVTSHNDDPEDETWAFSTGDIVCCALKEFDDGEKHLVIKEKVKNIV